MKWFTKTAIVIVAILIFGTIAWLLFKPENGPQIRTTTAERKTVTQDVTFTGHLESIQKSELSFETTGTIGDILVEVGDRVTKEQVLTHLDSSAVELELAKARANKVSAQEQAQLTWQKSEAQWTSNKVTNTKSLEKKRQAVRDEKTELDQYRTLHEQVAREQGEDDSTTRTAAANIKLAETAYHTAQQALNEALVTYQASEETDRYAADVSRAQYRATTQAAGNVGGLSSLAAQEALAQDKVSKKVISAPFEGTVTSINKETGETVTAGQPLVTIATVDQLKLTANVTETDAAKLSLDMPATITLDALPPQDQWPAKILRISPAAQIIEGVPTYEITLSLTDTDQRFKPGLTANITVHADQRDNVIAIPRRAVATRGEDQFVRVLDNAGNITEQMVTTGLIGSSGTIVITSGLSERDEVVIDTRELE